jgi:hypothetical protein
MILSGRLATSGHVKLCRDMAQTGLSPRRMDDALYMPGLAILQEAIVTTS